MQLSVMEKNTPRIRTLPGLLHIFSCLVLMSLCRLQPQISWLTKEEVFFDVVFCFCPFALRFAVLSIRRRLSAQTVFESGQMWLNAGVGDQESVKRTYAPKAGSKVVADKCMHVTLCNALIAHRHVNLCLSFLRISANVIFRFFVYVHLLIWRCLAFLLWLYEPGGV